MPVLGLRISIRSMDEGAATDADIVVEVSVVVIAEGIPADEMRLWWRSRETRVNDLVERAPKLLIGRTEVPGPTHVASDGPAGRVSALIFREGTLPDYRLPTLDAELIEAILDSLDPLPTDAFTGVGRIEAEAFLRSHAEAGVLTVSE